MVKRKLPFLPILPPQDSRPNQIWPLILNLPVTWAPVFKQGRLLRAPTLFPSAPEPSAALLTRLTSRALCFLAPRDFHPSPEPRRRRHGHHTCCILLVDLGECRRCSATFLVVAAVHAAGEQHTGQGGAWRPPKEADLQVAVLFRGGVPIGGHDRDGSVQVLL